MLKAREEIDLKDISPLGSVPISEKHRIAMIFAIPGTTRGSDLRTKAIDEALGQGVFLEFSPTTHSFEETPIHTELRQTLDDIKLLAKLELQVESDSWNPRLLGALAYPSGGSGSPCSALRENLLFGFAYYYRMENIFNGHVALCKTWLGLVDDFPVYQCRPFTPLGEDEERRLIVERISPQEVIRLIAGEIWPFGTGVMAGMFGNTRDDQIRTVAQEMRKTLNTSGLKADFPDYFFDEATAEFLDKHTIQSEEVIEDLSVD